MWDEALHAREDWDINIRAIWGNHPFVYVDEPVYIYRYRTDSVSQANTPRMLANTEKLLHKHHRRLADAGSREIARIYAENMWDLSRRYFYSSRKFGRAFRCARESFRYDPNPGRLLHPFQYRFQRLAGRALR
jgi:hypothetical protein